MEKIDRAAMDALTDQLVLIAERYERENTISIRGATCMLKVGEEYGEFIQAYLMAAGQARDKGHSAAELTDRLADEAADLLCMTLLACRFHAVDIAGAIERKWLSRLDGGGAPAGE